MYNQADLYKHMKLIKPILISFLLVGAIACSSTKKSASADKNAIKTEQPALSAELQQGHDLFTSNCGKCHKLPDPASLNTEGWRKMVDVMAPKAKLDQTQADLIYKYLVNK